METNNTIKENESEILSRIKCKLLYVGSILPAQLEEVLPKIYNGSYDLEGFESELDRHISQADELQNLGDIDLKKVIQKKKLIIQHFGRYSNEELFKILSDIPQLIEAASSDLSGNTKLRYELLKTIVINQDNALKKLCVYFHQFESYVEDLATKKHTIKPSNCPILVGDTGCGKTFMVEQVAKFFNFRVVKIDASRLTMEGYVGLHFGAQLLKAFHTPDDKSLKEKTEKIVVFIDEFDKLSTLYKSSNEYKGAGILYELLPFLDHKTKKLEVQKQDHQKGIEVIDVSNLLFVLGGAFERLQKQKQALVGFSSPDRSAVLENKLDLNDISELYPSEIAGRLGMILHLNTIDERCMRDILQNPHYEPLQYYKQFFKKNGEVLELSDSEIQDIVKLSMQKGTGARALRNVLDDYLADKVERIINI